MQRFAFLLAMAALAACSTANIGPEPSLAPRPSEAIDPRVPVPGEVPAGPVDGGLAAQLDRLVAEAKAGASQFDARQADADRLAAVAGPVASESWVAAQQALSLLVEQHGVTTRVAADIDALASDRLKGQRWIRPADQQAIAMAATEVAAINDFQAAAIDRLKDQLAR